MKREKDESGAGLNLAFHARGGLADSRRRATARLWRRASRGSAAAIAFQPLRGLLLGLERRALGSSQAARLLRAARELTPVCPACPVGRAGACLEECKKKSLFNK